MQLGGCTCALAVIIVALPCLELVLLLTVIITMHSQFWEPRMICSWLFAFVPLAVINVALLLSRGTLIVPACQPGWEEMENLRENLRKFGEILGYLRGNNSE